MICAARGLSRIVRTGSTDCRVNLAKEWALLCAPPSEDRELFLWRNRRVVVVGKNQSPAAECDLSFLARHRIQLARRPTGGGAVFQDLGNTCWTFLSPRPEVEHNNAVILEALRSLGADAAVSGRNDILVGARKVSGAAFRNTPDRSIHHGTMLLSVDLDLMARALTVDSSKLTAKGVASVRSRVTNLRDIVKGVDHDAFCKALETAYERCFGPCIRVEESEESLLRDPVVAEKYALLSSQSWLFPPQLNASFHAKRRFEWGLFDVSVEMAGNKMAGFEVHSDCLTDLPVDRLREFVRRLGTTKADPREIIEALVASDSPKDREVTREVCLWAATELSPFR